MNLREALWIGAAATVAVLAIGLLVLLRGDGEQTDELTRQDPGSATLQGTNPFCDRPLPPLSPAPITQADFDTADKGSDQAVNLAAEGDVSGAALVFFADVHDFTHNVDGPLRERNRELAKRLCNAVSLIEGQLAFGGEPAAIAEKAAGIRELLKQAAEELSFAPGGR